MFLRRLKLIHTPWYRLSFGPYNYQFLQYHFKILNVIELMSSPFSTAIINEGLIYIYDTIEIIGDGDFQKFVWISMRFRSKTMLYNNVSVSILNLSSWPHQTPLSRSRQEFWFFQYKHSILSLTSLISLYFLTFELMQIKFALVYTFTKCS